MVFGFLIGRVFFLVEYEDPIFMFANIYRSQSRCEEENKVSNSTLCMLKIGLIFCILLTQPKCLRF